MSMSDDFASTPVSGKANLDAGPGPVRLGLIVLATDQATERDFINMRPSDDIGIYTARIANTNPVIVENLRRMGPKLTEVASLLVPESRLDVIAYSCTSGAVAIGDEAVTANIHAAEIAERLEIELGKPVLTSIQAMFWAALRAVGETTAVPGWGKLLRT